MKLMLASLIAVYCVGCTTIHVESDPPGAEVWLDGKLKGTTPCDLKVSDGAFTNQRDVVVKKDGYFPTSSPITRYMTWYLSYAWGPKTIYAKLHKLEAAAPKPGE